MTEGALIGFREFSPEKEEERAGVKVGGVKKLEVENRRIEEVGG